MFKEENKKLLNNIRYTQEFLFDKREKFSDNYYLKIMNYLQIIYSKVLEEELEEEIVVYLNRNFDEDIKNNTLLIIR